MTATSNLNGGFLGFPPVVFEDQQDSALIGSAFQHDRPSHKIPTRLLPR
jgi:hypothetical protein